MKPRLSILEQSFHYAPAMTTADTETSRRFFWPSERECHESTLPHRRAGATEYDIDILAAAFGDRCDARMLLHLLGIAEALALLTERGNQARGQRGPGARKSAKYRVVGELGCNRGNGIVEAIDRLQRGFIGIMPIQ